MYQNHFLSDISRNIWNTKYRYRLGEVYQDQSIEDTWSRVAESTSQAERKDQDIWVKKYYGILKNFTFLPGGRILAGAGTAHKVTLFNCFVMGVIEDSMDEIFESLKKGALTMQQGGGIGYDFSTLRPKGAIAQTSGTIASGPVPFMRIWDSMCATLLSTGVRRGAMMATLRCDHPDIEEFVTIKHDKKELRHFNLSVQISDEFMKAVRNDENWPLVFPSTEWHKRNGGRIQIIMKKWPGSTKPVPCSVYKTIRAKDLWEKIIKSSYDFAEPGVLFTDQINRMNNLWYREQITTTNPCGEVPLPPFGACNLGSLNLTRFIIKPFADHPSIDLNSIRETTEIATRLLDTVIDVSHFPLSEMEMEARGTRHIGLGITGLADALIMLGLHYGKKEAQEIGAQIMQTICYTAYQTSIELAREKGSFPYFKKKEYLKSKFIESLPDDIIRGIEKYGIRNSHLLSIAPTGTISLLANNISSGIEPVFNFKHKRHILQADGSYKDYNLVDFAYSEWLRKKGDVTQMPEYFVDARHISPTAHLEMQAALQPFVDNAISKTVNVPVSFPFSKFKNLYDMAFDLGLKGCTTFRPNPVTGVILEHDAKAEEIEERHTAHCCGIEREAD